MSSINFSRPKQTVAALITARSGSTLKNKSFLPVAGEHCLSRAIHACLGSQTIDHYFVSTDCSLILDYCSPYGFELIKRKLELCSGTAQHRDVILDALSHINKRDCFPDFLLVVLPNNPFINSQMIIDAVERLQEDSSATSCVPVYPYNDHHPLRAKRILNGKLRSFFSDSSAHTASTNRQDLESCYYLSHNFWLIRITTSSAGSSELWNHGDSPWKFLGPSVVPLICPQTHDIHELHDVAICEAILGQKSNLEVEQVL